MAFALSYSKVSYSKLQDLEVVQSAMEEEGR